MTADWYSGPRSRWVSAAARISSGLSDGLFTAARYIAMTHGRHQPGHDARVRGRISGAAHARRHAPTADNGGPLMSLEQQRGAPVAPPSGGRRAPVGAVLAEGADAEAAALALVEEERERAERGTPGSRR